MSLNSYNPSARYKERAAQRMANTIGMVIIAGSVRVCGILHLAKNMAWNRT